VLFLKEKRAQIAQHSELAADFDQDRKHIQPIALAILSERERCTGTARTWIGCVHVFTIQEHT
jgi:hypothetical protein